METILFIHHRHVMGPVPSMKLPPVHTAKRGGPRSGHRLLVRRIERHPRASRARNTPRRWLCHTAEIAKSLRPGCEGHAVTSTRTHASGRVRRRHSTGGPRSTHGECSALRPWWGRHRHTTRPRHPHESLRARRPMTRKRKRGRTREGPPKAAVDPLGVAVTQRSHWARGGRTASAQEPRRGRAGGRQGAPSRALGPRRRPRSQKRCRQACHGGGDRRGPAARGRGRLPAETRGTRR